MGSLMTSSSSAGPIQISKFQEPWFGAKCVDPNQMPYYNLWMGTAEYLIYPKYGTDITELAV